MHRSFAQRLLFRLQTAKFAAETARLRFAAKQSTAAAWQKKLTTGSLVYLVIMPVLRVLT